MILDSDVSVLSVTMGDPGGIGPDVLARYLDEGGTAERGGLVIAGHASLLRTLSASEWSENGGMTVTASRPDTPPDPGETIIWDVGREEPDLTNRGRAATQNGRAAMSYLESGFSLWRDGIVDGLVTGPVSKSGIAGSNQPFSGQTEWLAGRLGVRQPVMGITSDRDLTVTVTRHIPVRKIPLQLTEERIVSTIRTTHRDLIRYFDVRSPRIGVCGLNPHAGESGTIGREEIDCIAPAVDELRSDDFQVDGPTSAESLLNDRGLSTYDAIVAMYHDQALVPMKARGLDRCASVTLGLGMVRTSVAHGTGYDLVGTDQFSTRSMENAIDLAIDMVQNDC